MVSTPSIALAKSAYVGGRKFYIDRFASASGGREPPTLVKWPLSVAAGVICFKRRSGTWATPLPSHDKPVEGHTQNAQLCYQRTMSST
jgi:hypothetical protein